MAFSHLARNTFTRIRKSHIAIAVLLVVVLIIWLASGNTYRAENEAPEQAAAQDEARPTKVETRLLKAQEYGPEQMSQGQLLPVREVEIRSQISAHIDERIVELGEFVTTGDLLFQLNQETRAAQLERAEADVKLRSAEVRAAERLFKDGLMSETEYLRLQSALAAAKADRELAALQQEYTYIRAPFNGIIDRLPVEEGDFVQVGQSLATLVDISTLELSAYIPQQRVHVLTPGLAVEATLLDGTQLPGRLTYVASRADSSTRSFRVEALIDNEGRRRIAGGSATLAIQLPLQLAHRLSPALLVLNDDGELGIKVVDSDKRVAFMPVTILGFDTSGVWVGGLPDEVELITLGGGFTQINELVDPVRAEGM